MKKEEGENDIVGDSENDVSDNFKLEIGIHPTTSSQLRLEPYSLSITGKVNLAPIEVGKFKALTENVSEKQHGSTSHGINIDVLGASSTENEAKNTFGYGWIQPHLVWDNSTLACEIDSYKKQLKEAKQKIHKVPTILRGVKGVNKCYDPMIVAIGPYHRANVKLKQMETFKILFALQYANQSGKSIKELYEEMEEQLIEAKNCYAEEVAKAFNDKKFAKMMFFDSCFVIQFMDSFVHPKMNDIETKCIETIFIRRDIMLLENQLPFKIIDKLMSLSLRFEGDKGKEMIDKFIDRIMNDPPIEEEAPRRKTCFWCCQTNSKLEGTREKKKEYIHLLEFVQTKFVNDKEIKNKARKEPSSNWCSYRSVKELKSVGIHFQPSKSRRFSDITFNSMYLYGRLRLPRLTIHDGTKSLLLNLVAFETCADTSSNFGVSSYVYFMDTLIDRPEDVTELRSKGIILNFLSSDEEVANLFNEIGENVVFDDQVFGNVKDSLNAFCKSNPRLWLAEFLHFHFRKPWAIIAFFGAIVVLSLTITQTVFSAIQL